MCSSDLNLSKEEWNLFVGRDIPHEMTCKEADIKIRVREVK